MIGGVTLPVMKFLFVILCCLPMVALAGLGDSEAKCVEKLGPSVKETGGSGVGEKLLYYEKGGMGIGVEYWKGKAACFFYKKTIRSEKLTDAEIEAFLAESSEGSYWEGAHVIGEGTRWARNDGKALAHYIAPQGLLIVMTDSFALERMKKKGTLGQ
jgi:hypothetical protein